MLHYQKYDRIAACRPSHAPARINQRKRGTVDRFPYPHGLAACNSTSPANSAYCNSPTSKTGRKSAKDTISLIEASLDATRPDLVIFNGNQIAGYDSAYALTSRKRRWDARPASASSEASGERYAAALEHTRELVRATIEQLVHPLADRGVPWAVTFGNHDFQCGLDNDEIESICREFPGCINPERAADGTTGIAVKHGVKHDVGDMEQDFGLPEQPVMRVRARHSRCR